MVIVKEYYTTRDDGVNLYRTYSDKGLKIQKVGTEEIYDEAVDVENSGFEYVETDMPREFFSAGATEEDYPEITN